MEVPKAKDSKVEGLKALGMSDDEIADWQEYRLGKETKAKVVKAKEIATSMCAKEGGVYYTEYAKLEAQMDAIWNKSMKEARKQVGLAEE